MWLLLISRLLLGFGGSKCLPCFSIPLLSRNKLGGLMAFFSNSFIYIMDPLPDSPEKPEVGDSTLIIEELRISETFIVSRGVKRRESSI